jgi:predicted nucleic acid-binding protein
MPIFDASTLILIAKIELLDTFLAAVSMEVAIPREVARECCDAKQTVDALRIRNAIDEGRVKIMSVKNKSLIDRVQGDFALGRGEAEALALAVTERAQLIGIDDKNGIEACKLLRLPFTTAIAILIRSREKGLVSLNEARTKIDLLAQFGRYKDSIIKDARKQVESGK